MKKELKKELIDTLQTAGLCAVGMAIVFHLNSMLKSDESNAPKTQETTQEQKNIGNAPRDTATVFDNMRIAKSVNMQKVR